MKYIEIGTTDNGDKLFGQIDDDGLMRVTCIESNPDYQAWIALGNTADTLAANSAPQTNSTES